MNVEDLNLLNLLLLVFFWWLRRLEKRIEKLNDEVGELYEIICSLVSVLKNKEK